MFGIIARALNIATRTDRGWNAPDHWSEHDHRTRAQRERDAMELRGQLRMSGIL